MKVFIVKNYNEMSIKAAQLIANQIIEKKNTVLGLATGQTPVGMYKELVRKFQKGELDFSEVVTFNLDEYYGLSPKHPQSYYYFMWNTFFKYEYLIKKNGGIDLQILGIGDNGHLGFNEPAVGLNSKTHLVNLSESTIQANSQFFSDIREVPKKAITMGIGTIMGANKILLLASGRKKAGVIGKTVNSSITTNVPASVLQLHNDVTLIIDQEAAYQLDRH